MPEVKLLDCTLRDGGYVNDWKFGHDNLVCIFERMVDAGIDFIEIGFLDERRSFDMDRSIMPDTDSVGKLFGGLDRKGTKVLGMIDFGTCGIEKIRPKKASFLDGIRVIFKKHLRKEAMEFCAQLKALGYLVFAQMVSVTSYEDGEMLDLIRLANEVQPYAVSMVDTYGLMYRENIRHYFELLNTNLDSEIAIGYHAHNNFQMGYANCIAMMSLHTKRDLLVDGTVYGMGKSAGNAPIELIAMWMNENLGKNYHLSQILEAIDSNISNFYTPATWGYNMFFFVAAQNECHPSYVSYLMEKRTLSIRSVNRILARIPKEKKLLYDAAYIEGLYKDYQDREMDDGEALSALETAFAGRNLLLLAPGANLHRQQERVRDYIRKENPLVVSVNFIEERFPIDYLFLTNSKRYVQLATVLSRKDGEYRVIATSNVAKTNGTFDYVLKYSSFIDREAEVIDNPFLMFLKVLGKTGVRKVALAGFDGYRGTGEADYIRPNLEYHFGRKEAERVNRYVTGELRKGKDRMETVFITDSIYEREDGRTENES